MGRWASVLVATTEGKKSVAGMFQGPEDEAFLAYSKIQSLLKDGFEHDTSIQVSSTLVVIESLQIVTVGQF